MVRLPLSVAITSLLGRTDDPIYRNVGQNMKVDDLYKLLGLKGSPMIYKYKSGETDNIGASRALIIFEKFDILIDKWLTEEELRADAINTGMSKELAKEQFVEIMEMLVELEPEQNLLAIKRGLRQILARFY